MSLQRHFRLSKSVTQTVIIGFCASWTGLIHRGLTCSRMHLCPFPPASMHISSPENQLFFLITFASLDELSNLGTALIFWNPKSPSPRALLWRRHDLPYSFRFMRERSNDLSAMYSRFWTFFWLFRFWNNDPSKCMTYVWHVRCVICINWPMCAAL